MIKKVGVCILALLLSSGIYAQAFQWALQGGGTGTSSTSDRGEAVATDSQGNVVVTGIFEGTSTFGSTNLTSAGSIDIFVAKYAPSGSMQWVIKAGGTSLDWPKAICTDKNDNIFITGQFSGTATFGSTSITASATDIFTAKYNSSGVLQWVKKEGGSSINRGLAIGCDTLGNVYVAGDFSGTATFGSTSYTSLGAADIFIMKYNSAGTVQWAKKAGDIVNDRVMAITVDDDGNIYVAGSFGGTVTFGSTTISATGGNNDTDIFTAKYSSSGNVLWVAKGGSNAMVVEEARGISLDDSGNIYVTGLFGGTASFGSQNISSNGSTDMFVVKYNNAGVAQWARSGGGTQEEEGTGISVSPSGNIYATGFFIGSASFDSDTLTAFSGSSDFDCFAVGYNSNGQLLWVKSMGRVGEDKATGIAAAPDNQLYITGYFRNNILFDQLQVNALGYSDMFLAQINDFIYLDTLVGLNYCAGENVDIVFNKTIIFNTVNNFTAWLSDASGSFVNSQLIGTLPGPNAGTIQCVLPSTLINGTNYRIRVESSSPNALSLPGPYVLSITESPAPPNLLSNSEYCYADSITSLEVDGQNVSWFSDLLTNNLIFSGNTLGINDLAINDTVFYVTQQGNGCISPLSIIDITVHSIPVLTVNMPDTTQVCENAAPISVNILPSGGYCTGLGTTGGLPLFDPSLVNTGVNEVVYTFTDSASCASSSTIYFNVLPSPVVLIDTTPAVQITYFDTLYLSGTPQGGTFSGDYVTGNYFVAPVNSTCNPCEVLYIYESSNGCVDTAFISVSLYVNSIGDINENDFFTVFPNPVNDVLNIQLNGKFEDELTLSLYDREGRLVIEKKSSGNQIVPLSTKSISKGYYILRCTSERHLFQRSIIKL